MKRLLLLFGALAMLLAACGGNDMDLDDEEVQAYVDEGKTVVELMNKGKYEAIREKFNAEMKEELSLKDLEDLTPVIEDAGNFQEFSKSSIEKKDDMYGVVLVTQYSAEKLIFAVSFDENMEIGGLFIQ